MHTWNKKILIVDDEEKIVEVIKSYLEHNGFEVYCAYNGKEAIEICRTIEPSLVILDLMLPDLSGEEICKELRKDSRVPIIMLSAKVEEESIIHGLDIGADDYMTKPFSVRQLVARVASLLRRVSDEALSVSNQVTFNHGDLVIDHIKHEVRKNGTMINLTPNEFKLLKSFAKYPQKTFTRGELIDVVMGVDYDGYDRTVDVHIKNLRQKIENQPKNPVYIITVHGIGYKFGGVIHEN